MLNQRGEGVVVGFGEFGGALALHTEGRELRQLRGRRLFGELLLQGFVFGGERFVFGGQRRYLLFQFFVHGLFLVGFKRKGKDAGAGVCINAGRGE